MNPKKNVISQTCKTLAIHENWPPQIQMVSHNLELNVWETVSVELSSIDRAPTHCPMRWTLIWSTQGNKPSPTSREAPSSPVTTPSPWSEGTCTQLIIHPQMLTLNIFLLMIKVSPVLIILLFREKFLTSGDGAYTIIRGYVWSRKLINLPWFVSMCVLVNPCHKPWSVYMWGPVCLYQRPRFEVACGCFHLCVMLLAMRVYVLMTI